MRKSTENRSRTEQHSVHIEMGIVVILAAVPCERHIVPDPAVANHIHIFVIVGLCAERGTAVHCFVGADESHRISTHAGEVFVFVHAIVEIKADTPSRMLPILLYLIVITKILRGIDT